MVLASRSNVGQGFEHFRSTDDEDSELQVFNLTAQNHTHGVLGFIQRQGAGAGLALAEDSDVLRKRVL